MKLNKGSISTFILVFFTAIIFVGSIFYLRETHPGLGKIPFLDKQTSDIEDSLVINDSLSNIKVDAGPDIVVKYPTNSFTLKGSATTKDGGWVNYMWFKLSGGKATIVSPDSSTTVVKNLQNGIYIFRLVVTDSEGYKSADELYVTASGFPATTKTTKTKIASNKSTSASTLKTTTSTSQQGINNIPPFASAGPDKYVTLPTSSVTLLGSGSDSDGSIVSYNWTKISGGSANIVSPNSSSTEINNLVLGSYVFRLTVVDNKNDTSYDDVSVIVNDESSPQSNNPPYADAGPDETITMPDNFVTLSGYGNDSDGSIVSYNWTKISGGSATISNPSSDTTDVDNLSAGTYVFKFTVTDNQGATGTDTITVTVENVTTNNPPVADAGPDQTITLPEGYLTLNGNGTDSDGYIDSFLWTKVSGGPATIVDPTSDITDVDDITPGTYVFRLTVTDDYGDTNSDDVTITVN